MIVEIVKQKARGEKKSSLDLTEFCFFSKNVYSVLNEGQPATFSFIYPALKLITFICEIGDSRKKVVKLYSLR